MKHLPPQNDPKNKKLAAQKALESANTKKALPRALHILGTDSDEPSERFPQLVGLLHGWGELFGFTEGRCDLYLALGKDLGVIDRMIELLYQRA